MSKFCVQFFLRAIFVGCEQFFADVSSIALANPVLSQPDMEWEMVTPPAGAYIPSFTIYHLLPDRPGAIESLVSTRWQRSTYLDFTRRVAFVSTLRFGLKLLDSEIINNPLRQICCFWG